MSGIYKTWEERRNLVNTKGDRAIKFYLLSTSASPLLAAVGTPKSGRHYVYRVSKDFLETFGSSPTINAHTKWTSRKPVHDWLATVVRNDNLSPTKPDRHNVPTQEDNGSLDAIGRSEPSGVQEQEPSGVELVEPKASQPASFQVGDNFELLSLDLDMSNWCWYKCKILKISKRCWKVQYYDRKDEEGSHNLQQYILPPRLAPADEMSMRHPGRLTIRPCPPEEEHHTFYEVGAAVDAWWNNGWWEGFVLTGVSLSSSDHYHVFFPGQRRFLVVHREDLRVSREWIDDRWVPIEPRSDILSFVFSYYK